MLNEKRSIIRSSIPGKPCCLSLCISEAHIGFLLCFNYCFLNFLKFLTLLAYYLSELVACCANCCSECYYCCKNHS